MKKKTEKPLAMILCLVLVLVGIFLLNPDNIFQHSVGIGLLSFPIFLLIFWLLYKRRLFTIAEAGKELDTVTVFAFVFAIIVMVACVVFFVSSVIGILALVILVLAFSYFALYPRHVQKKLDTYLNHGQPHLLLSGKYSSMSERKKKRYGYDSRKANAFFQMGKWKEALAALDEYVKVNPYNAYIYYYNKAIYLLFADDFPASQDAYDEFQKQLDQIPKDQVNENGINTIKEQYRLVRAYKQENSEESLRKYLEFLPTIFSKPPKRLDEIVLHYFQGVYELQYGSAQLAIAHFDFILGTDSTAWYHEAARLEREKAVAQIG